MENIDKGLTVPKWVVIVLPKIPQMLQNLSAQFVCPTPKVLDLNEKRLHWESVVRELTEKGVAEMSEDMWLGHYLNHR